MVEIVEGEDIVGDNPAIANAGIRKTPLVWKIGDYQSSAVNAAVKATTPKKDNSYGGAASVPQVISNKGLGSDSANNYAASVLGLIAAKQFGSDPYEEVALQHDVVSTHPNAQGYVVNEVSKSADSYAMQMLQEVTAEAGLDEASKQKVKSSVETLLEWSKAKKDNVWGFERIFTRQLATGLTAMAMTDSNFEKETAFRQMANVMVSRRWDSASKVDITIDAVKTMFLPSTVTTLSQSLNKYDSNAVQDLLDLVTDSASRVANLEYKGKGKKAYDAALKSYWKLPAEKRAITFQGIESHLEEIAGKDNTLVYLSLIYPFINKAEAGDVWSEIDYAADTATIGMFGIGKAAKLVKFIKEIKNSAKPIKILRDAGDEGRAAATLIKASEETDPAKLSKATGGMTKDEVAASMHPIEIPVDGQISGLTKQAAKQLEDSILINRNILKQKIDAATDPSSQLQLDYLDASAKEAYKRKILGRLNTDDGPTQGRIISEDKDGFTVEIFDDTTYTSIDPVEIESQISSLEKAARELEVDKLKISKDASRYKEAGFPDELVQSITAEDSAAINTRLNDITSKLDDLKSTYGARKNPNMAAGGKQETVKLFRGVAAGRDADSVVDTEGGALFYSKLDSVAERYAGEGGNVVERDIDFKNRLDGQRLVDIKKSLNLPTSASMRDVVKTAQQAGYDGLSFSSTTGTEYVHFPSVKVSAYSFNPPTKYKIESYKYSYDEAGNFNSATRIGYAESKIKSAVHTIDKYASGITGDATLTEFSEYKNISQLRKAFAESQKGMTSAGRDRLNKVLLAGDEGSKEYTTVELLDGVDTPWGKIKLETANEFSAYYAAREMSDSLWQIKKDLRLRELGMAHYKELHTGIKFADGQEIVIHTKPADFVKSLDNEELVKNATSVIDITQNGKVVKLSDATLKARIEAGSVVIAKLRGKTRFGNEDFTYAVIDPEKLHTPTHGGFYYTKGYVPRLREGVNYIVKQNIPRTVNGKLVKYNLAKGEGEVVSFFSSKGDAIKYINSQENPGDFQWWPDRRLAANDRVSEVDEAEYEALNFGGMFNGQRSDNTMLYGLDGELAERKNYLASFDMYIKHVSNRMSTFDLKQSLIGKFQNTYGEYLTNPINWESNIKAATLKQDPELARTIEHMRSYIKDFVRMPDPVGEWLTARVRSVGEWMEGKAVIGGKPREALLSFATTDPVGLLKTAAFHQYLGFFNVRSLMTQAFGMSIAVTAYPTKAWKLFPQMTAVRFAALLDNPTAISSAEKAAGAQKGWLKNVLSELHKSGLIDSLVTSSDMSMVKSGQGYTKEMISKFAHNGQVFTREGEFWSRTYGYLLARDLFLKNKPANYVLSDKEVAQVVKDSLKFTMNLNKSARAAWQKGPMSIPTQFWQVMTKFMENITATGSTRQWTSAEKSKIMMGHLVLFGTAGIPYVDELYNSADNAYGNSKNEQAVAAGKAPSSRHLMDFTGLDPEMQNRLVTGGVNDAVAFLISGADVDVSRGVSIPGGIQDTIDLNLQGDKSILSIAAGASIPAIARIYRAFIDAGKDTAPVIRLISAYGVNDTVNNPGWEAFDSNFRWRLLSDFAGIASSTKNFSTAAWWSSATGPDGRKGIMLTTNGNYLMDLPDSELNNTIVTTALGIQSKKRRQAYEMSKGIVIEKEVEARIEAATSAILRLRTDPANDFPNSYNSAVSSFYVQAATVDMREQEKKKIIAGIMRKLADNKTYVEKYKEKALEEISKGYDLPKQLNYNLNLTPNSTSNGSSINAQ